MAKVTFLAMPDNVRPGPLGSLLGRCRGVAHVRVVASYVPDPNISDQIDYSPIISDHSEPRRPENNGGVRVPPRVSPRSLSFDRHLFLGDDVHERKGSRYASVKRSINLPLIHRRILKKPTRKEHHLWMKRDSTGSGQKALNLVNTVSKLPNDKEVIYGALDRWTAWETEFPVIAAAKALEILRRRNQWLRIIQVTKWLLNKGQVLTLGTYDTLLLAFNMEGRIDEAESIWNVVFADMEELGVNPDEDTARRIGRAFAKLGQVDKQKLVLEKYLSKWKYIHFNGERVRVQRTHHLVE
uniref:Pentatricopeptide repeat-containing protein n=1 Tax=Ananas comosus var. bracteatus TaxID=296719 RepID=A0A6V7NL38_ANACO|nr:unnamed protein product [Ananas comosus var. bracteatus]